MTLLSNPNCQWCDKRMLRKERIEVGFRFEYPRHAERLAVCSERCLFSYITRYAPTDKELAQWTKALARSGR